MTKNKPLFMKNENYRMQYSLILIIFLTTLFISCKKNETETESTFSKSSETQSEQVQEPQNEKVIDTLNDIRALAERLAKDSVFRKEFDQNLPQNIEDCSNYLVDSERELIQKSSKNFESLQEELKAALPRHSYIPNTTELM